MELIQSGMRLAPARLNAGDNGVKALVTSGTLTSGTYLDVPGSTSFPFTKYSLASRIRVDMKVLAFSDATSTGLRLGVRINGIDYDVALGYYTTANQYLPVSGFAIVTSGQVPGVYTLQARWRRTTGAGVINYNSGISELDMSAREVV